MLTPVIFGLTWYYGIKMIFNSDYDIVQTLISKIKSSNIQEEEDEEDDFDVNNYELLDVEDLSVKN